MKYEKTYKKVLDFFKERPNQRVYLKDLNARLFLLDDGKIRDSMVIKARQQLVQEKIIKKMNDPTKFSWNQHYFVYETGDDPK